MRFNFHFLLSPWTILVSVVIGVIIGYNNQPVAAFIAPFGKMYLTFLQMCVIPILISAVSSSIGKLIRASGMNHILTKMLGIVLISLTLVSAIGVAAGLIGQPGTNLDDKTRASLGEVVKSSEFAPDLELSLSHTQETKETTPSVMSFFINMIPKNVFEALARGETLSLIFFSIIFGIAIGFVREKSEALNMIQFMELIYESFQWLIQKAMYLLPLCLMCLLADQVSKVGLQMLFAMIKFIVIFYVAGFTILLINLLIIWKYSKLSFKKSIQAQIDPIIVAIGTLSSLASIPAAISSLTQKLHLNSNTTNLCLPLGVVICRYGNVVYFAIATIFIAQLYDTSLEINGLIVVLIGSILAGVATAGATGIVTLQTMYIVLAPLGLPLEAALVLFIAIDPIIDPMRTLLIIHSNMATTTVIASAEKSTFTHHHKATISPDVKYSD